VFSLTKFPHRRKQVVDRINPGWILNIGCGSTPYLNKELLGNGNVVVAGDFCKDMIDVAEKKLTDDKLEYVVADCKNMLFDDNFFDTVISVNSILPPSRDEVNSMFGECYRVLRKGGVFVAFLVSYDNVLRAKEKLDIEIGTDPEELRVQDTTGWQCYHTPRTIDAEIKDAGFRKLKLEQVFLDTRQEIDDLKRIYDVDSSKSSVYEYLLTAIK